MYALEEGQSLLVQMGDDDLMEKAHVVVLYFRLYHKPFKKNIYIYNLL